MNGKGAPSNKISDPMSDFAKGILAEYVPPPFYNFRPFYTLQPVMGTREKQLKLWRELILQYHSFHKLYTMPDPYTFHLFRNESLERSLNKEGIKQVIDSLISENMAEWENKENPTTLIIMLTSPAALSSQLYDWANNTGNIDTMMTFYDIFKGSSKNL